MSQPDEKIATMTSAERFRAVMHYQPVDHVTDMEFGYWSEIYTQWPTQGLPALPANDRAFELYFGLEQMGGAPIATTMLPGFTRQAVEIKDGYEYFTDGDGVLCRRPANGLSTMPEHLQYPLTDEKDWVEKFLPRLDPERSDRVAENLEATIDWIEQQNNISVVFGGSLLGTPRNWIGFEQICMTMCTNPALIERIMDDLTRVSYITLERALPRIAGKVCALAFWEDICFNAGPMVSPEWFRRMATPRYKQLTDLAKRHGIDIAYVDCDGQILQLVDCWLEGGVNTMFPLERNGGSDPVLLRQRYGRDLRLMGGVNKVTMAQGGDAIRRELEALAPVVTDGGYIPFCDHRCPPNVTLEKYREYLKAKREIFGIPQKEEMVRESALGLE